MPKRTIIKPASGIRAIAEALDISVATVHRALHNQGRVSQATRERVLRMAEEQKYQPNLTARNLRLNRHFRVSVHLPTTIAAFFDSLRAGIEEAASPFRSVLEVEFHRYTRNPGRAQASLRSALEAGVHGIIAVPPNTTQMARLVKKARERAIPVICVSTDSPESGRLTAVTPHPYYGGCMAAEVLAASMRKRGHVVVMAGDLENLNQTEKVRGFLEMLARTDANRSVTLIETRDDPEQAFKGALRCLRETPQIGGMYVTSANSIPVLQALRKEDRLYAIPVVTTDLFPELVPYLRDGAVRATIYQCPEMQGSLAIRAMYQYLMESIAPPSCIGVIPQLVIKSNLELYLRKSAEQAGKTAMRE